MKRHFLIGIGLAVATAGSLHAQEPVVSVNGDVLTQQQFDQALDQRTQGRSGQLPDAQKRQFLQQLVDLQLLAQMAEGRGIADDPAVQAELADAERS
ncbi:MAG: SurA N-terminal domain-containing protein, partial [Arhodomonas sp.]|nr:SurA N-terminal domain-containing protein [Arhodomonas sp.]